VIVEDVSVQVISVARPEWIHPFTGLNAAQFRHLVRLVAARGGDAIADGRPGRQWALDLPDRVLLVAAYWRTNLTMRQIGPLFGVFHSAAHRVIDSLGPLLALAPVRRRRLDQVTIVDGTLVPTRDHRLAARSKNYRYSTNLQVAIDANTRLVVALGDPQPGNRNDTVVYRSSGINTTLAGRLAALGRRHRARRSAVPRTPDLEERRAVHVVRPSWTGPLLPAAPNPNTLVLRRWWNQDDPGAYDDQRHVARFAIRDSGPVAKTRTGFGSPIEVPHGASASRPSADT
jgi:hypothetical protein